MYDHVMVAYLSLMLLMNDGGTSAIQKAEMDGLLTKMWQPRCKARAMVIWTQVLSFAAMQWTLRRLDSVVLGKAFIQLELMLSTLLFCALEGFRLALTKPKSDFQVAWLSIPVGTLISFLALMIHWGYASSWEDVNYRSAGVL